MQRHTAVPFWRDVRVLTAFSQILFLLLIIVIVVFLYSNLSAAMRQRGLVAGFGFLNLESGFEIGEKLIPYRPTDTYARALLVGLLNTLLVSIVGIVLATVIGIVVGVSRLSSNWLVNRLASAYIEVIRNTPLLVQLFFIYFGFFVKLPPISQSQDLLGSVFLSQRGVFIPRPVAGPSFTPWFASVVIGLIASGVIWKTVSVKTRRTGYALVLALAALLLTPVVGWFLVGVNPVSLDFPVRGRFNFSGGLALTPEFSALLTGLVLYTAGFIAEVIRGGLQAVRKGQIEAARALGLGEFEILQLVIFPQAMRVIVPPLTSQYLNLAKNSSLAIGIGYPDLFSVGATVANQTGQPVSVIVLVMGLYLLMSLLTSLIMNIYNRRVQVMER